MEIQDATPFHARSLESAKLVKEKSKRNLTPISQEILDSKCDPLPVREGTSEKFKIQDALPFPARFYNV